MLAIIFTLLGLVVLLVIVGLCLPSRVTVERSLTIDRPAEKIFPWAADLKLWPQWTVWNATEDPSLAYTYPGPTTGPGGSMVWTAKKMGAGSLKFVHFEAGRALHYELVMPAHGTKVYGEIEFESAGGGATRVTWLDEVDLGGNPFKKLFGPMLKKTLGRCFERNLQGLKTAALSGQAAGPGPK
ncbi:MAG: SRPBCC family protein [Opitutae bacterium]|nr:SRPBCC family protein [Opitutae bacterium]